MLNQLWNDESGFIISAEMTLVLSITVLGIVVGLSEIAVAVNTELNDISNAIGALHQSYAFTGFVGAADIEKSYYTGSRFANDVADCDLNTSCDIITGVDAVTYGEGTIP